MAKVRLCGNVLRKWIEEAGAAVSLFDMVLMITLASWTIFVWAVRQF